MKTYTKPSFEAIELNAKDIIQTSLINGSQGDFTGDNSSAVWGKHSAAADTVVNAFE